MVGDIYGRAQCGQLIRSAQLLATAGDLIEALALGWTASIDVIVTLASRLVGHSDQVKALLLQLLAPDIAVLVLLPLLAG